MTTENPENPENPENTENPDAPVPPPAAEPVAAETPRTRLRDRLFRFRSLLAVACASLIIGGAGGAVIGHLISGDDDGRDRGRFPGQRHFPDGHFPGRGPGGMPGQGQGDVQPEPPGEVPSSGTNS